MHVPVFLGSGVTQDNVQNLLCYCDGAIVGSNFKLNNDWRQPVCEDYVKSFMEEVQKLRHKL
ncbi:hypothetical protein SDC9_167831 [bioreactor metagenome]|uniref:Uncharacterized protein n=1 Tax=bioreactor metagenome TaxID=1076179 RepID=A0A645G3D3_9ZZZZ